MVPAKIAPLHKEWAKYLRDKVPGESRVQRYYDEGEKHQIDIFTSRNDEGTVAATVGLMDHDQSQNPAVSVFTEILMDAKGPNSVISNVLSTIAFFVIKDGWKVRPGAIFEKMIEMYDAELSVKHVMFAPPFQWDNGMTKVQLSTKTIYPLLAVPITDAERDYAFINGTDALENRWAHDHVDVLDWGRH